MNSSKLTKLVLSAIIVAPMVFAGCSSDDDDSSSTTPPPDAPEPTDGITGIWEGGFSKDTNRVTIDYDVGMMFYKDPALERGTSGGVALGDGSVNDAVTDNPHFLFEGGYQFFDTSVESRDPNTDELVYVCEVPNPDYPADDGGVWAIGRFGSQGTFLQEFEYATGSAAGPNQRGAGCLYKSGNKLTGEIQFEQPEAGKLYVEMTYSTENTRAVSVSDLGSGNDGSADAVYHLWSNDNSGKAMSYTTLNADGVNEVAQIAVVEDRDDTAVCGSNVELTKVADHNLFLLGTMEPHVTGCNIVTPPTEPDVNLEYQGLGALVDADDDGSVEFVHLMKSKGGGAGITAHALYNEFNVTP